MPSVLPSTTLVALALFASAGGSGAAPLAQSAGVIPSQQAAAKVPFDVSGSWVGALEADGTRRRLVLVLRERENGDVLGYVMGGAGAWWMVGGTYRHGRLQLEIEWSHRGGSGSVLVEGALSGGVFTGTSDDGSGPVPLTLRRRGGTLHERRLVVGGQAGGASALLVVTPVLDTAGRLVAGTFADHDEDPGCGFVACAGRITSFSESGGNLSVGLTAGGPCPLSAEVSATFDPATLFYSGGWTYTGCGGPGSGAALGARSTGTRSDHVQQILGALAALGDELESGSAFGPSHPSVSPSFLHLGRTAADLLSGLDAETGAFDFIEARFLRIHPVATVDGPGALPGETLPYGAGFEEMRSGIPVGGGSRETYLDTRSAPVLNLMRDWAEENGSWRIHGNQLPGFELPLDYQVGASELELPTPGGTVYASVGPWGGHFSPVGNHTPGDAKTSLIGFLTADDSDLSELVGNGNGVFELGETWGYWGGPNGDLVRNKTPLFVAPWDGVVIEVEYFQGPNPFFFDDAPHWEVVLEFPGEIRMALKHVAAIADDLAPKLLATTGIDPTTFTGPPGTELLAGAQIPVQAGEGLCHPQIVAKEVAGFPGWYRGDGGHGDRPWVTMEIYTSGPVGAETGNVSVYELLDPAERAVLQAVVDADVTHPKSQRYWTYESRRWMWAAETRVSMAYSSEPRDFSGLYTSLGGWIEIDGVATTSDEMVAFCPIADEVAGYDPALYDPANVGWLLTRERANSVPFLWTMPDGSTLTTSYPTTAEVLELESDQLLLAWRDIGYAPGGGAQVTVYQRAAYVLDAAGLKVAWGAFADTPAGAVQPTLLPSDPCDDVDVICYDHTHQPGY